MAGVGSVPFAGAGEAGAAGDADVPAQLAFLRVLLNASKPAIELAVRFQMTVFPSTSEATL